MEQKTYDIPKQGRRLSDFRPISRVGGMFEDYRAEFVNRRTLESFQICRNHEEALLRAEMYAHAYWNGQAQFVDQFQFSTNLSTPKKPKVLEANNGHGDTFSASKDGQVMCMRSAYVFLPGRRMVMEFYTMSWV
jgi:hypothetical protein